MSPTLSTLMENGKRATTKVFRDKGRVEALVMVHDALTHGIVCFPFKAETDQREAVLKRACIRVIHGLRLRGRFGGAVIQSEAWMSSRAKDELNAKPFVRPIDSANRKEALIVHAWDVAGNKQMATCYIERLHGVSMLSQWETFNGEFHSWMDTAFTDAESILAK